MTGSANDVAFLSITELVDAFDRRELSSVDVTRAQLDRIAAYDEALNAFITVLADAALEQAAAADNARAGGETSPLLGVPIALKDLFVTAGVRTTAGSKVLADWVPGEDGTVVRRLKAAGAVILGKTNMMEFAYGYPHPDFGESHNPWDLTRTAGGSSGGSAAAVAAGLAYAGMGSDTGGSIRSPAAYTGLVGLKATYGLVSRAGVIPLSWSLDHAGPLTRTVRDTAIIFDAIAGYDPADPASAQVEPEFTVAGLDAPVDGLRVAVIEDLFERFVEPGIKPIARAAVEKLRELGIEAEPVQVPSVALVGPTIMPILQAEATSYHWPAMQEGMDDYGPIIRANLQLGVTVLAKDYLDAQRVRRQLHDEVEELLTTFDALVFPTQPIVAPQIDAYGMPEMPEGDVLDVEIGHTGWANLTGHPAVSVPCGFTEAGLPVGLQFTGRLFDDATILRLANHYERETGWHERRPEFSG
ncbi:Asp-tRNA(Asn)/Glu-tRNA(Gln) amidotransferase subunit GatA [soil metagenome]